jgi:hypothetical protein
MHFLFIPFSRRCRNFGKSPGSNGAKYKPGNGPIFPSKLSREWEVKGVGGELTLSLLNVLELVPPRTSSRVRGREK